RRAGGLTCCDHFAFADRSVLLLGLTPCAANALNAISALLHDTAATHGDVGVENRFDDFVAETAVFLAIGISEEIEPAHLVGAVRLTKTRADAAVVDLNIKSFAVMNGSRHWTDRFARCVLAMHTSHWREALTTSNDVFVDAQPVHVAALGDF